MAYTTDTTGTAWNTWTNYQSTDTIVWNCWVDNGTNSVTTTTTTTNAWVQWQDAGTSGTSAKIIYRAWCSDYEETKEQKADRERREVEYLAQMEQRRREDEARRREEAAIRKEEAERAAALLNEYLSEDQRKALKEKGEFEVVAESGKVYAIKRGCAGNVFSLDEKRRQIAKHCIHPIDSVPDHDAMLAQMMWLKWNEAEFLKVANTTKLAA